MADEPTPTRPRASPRGADRGARRGAPPTDARAEARRGGAARPRPRSRGEAPGRGARGRGAALRSRRRGAAAESRRGARRRGGCPPRSPPAEERPPPRPRPPAGAAEELAADEHPQPSSGRAERRARKPAIPGADLEVDIVAEGSDPLGRGASRTSTATREDDVDGEEDADGEQPSSPEQPIAAAAIDLAADARYSATGKRKTAVARVILKPGTGAYTVNGQHARRVLPARDAPAQRSASRSRRSATRTRMDVIARMHGGGVSAQAGALRHGISRALLEADPNLRGELKRRGFLTRDARAKERKKAGLKKARKRPQFCKR